MVVPWAYLKGAFHVRKGTVRAWQVARSMRQFKTVWAETEKAGPLMGGTTSAAPPLVAFDLHAWSHPVHFTRELPANQIRQ